MARFLTAGDIDFKRADIFWRQILITRYFNQWQGSCTWKERRAVWTCERRAMQKGFNGLKWAVQKTKACEDLAERKVETLQLRQAFNKWKNETDVKRIDCLQRAFTKWRVNVKEIKRCCLLDAKATNHVLSRMYYQWKLAMYQTQSARVADLHYKSTVLYNFFDIWHHRADEATAEKRVAHKAVTHYETNLCRIAFTQMRILYAKNCDAKSHYRRRTLLSVVCSWHQATRLTKMEKLQELSAARELRRHHLLRAAFSYWHQQLLGQRAEGYHEKLLLRKSFAIWKHETKDRVEQDKLQVADTNRLSLKQALNQWRNNARIQKDAYKTGATILQGVWLKAIMNKWKCYTVDNKELRNQMQSMRNVTNTRTMRRIFAAWKRRLYNRLRAKEAREVWSQSCARKAAQLWKRQVRLRKLNGDLEELKQQKNQHRLAAFFNQWRTAHRHVLHLNLRGATVSGVLSHSRLRHFFTSWRIRVKESQLISPLRERVERKTMTRAFDAWRMVMQRQKLAVGTQTHQNHEHLLKAFQIWRCAHEEVQHSVRARQHILSGVKRRVLTSLHEVVQTKKRANLFNQKRLLHFAFLVWRNQYKERQEHHAVCAGEQARRVVLLSSYFKQWRQRVASSQREDENVEMKLRQASERRELRNFWQRWHHRLDMERKTRDFQSYSQKKLLSKILQEWHHFAQTSVTTSVDLFTLRMTGVSPLRPPDNSYGDSLPLSRSPTVESSGFHSSVAVHGCAHSIDQEELLGYPQQPCGRLSPIVQLNLPPPDDGYEISIEVTPCDSDGSDEFMTPDGSPMKLTDIMMRTLTIERKATVDKINSYRLALTTEQANLNQEARRFQTGSCVRNLFQEEGEKPSRKNRNLTEFVHRILTKWRNWPISVAFEQWKEYVQILKIERAKVMALGQRSEVLLKQRMINEWKRQFTLLRRADEHRNLVLKRHAFDALMMYAHLEKKQAKMQEIAAEYYVTSIICRSFSLWKDKACVRLRWEQMLSASIEETSAACRVADAFHETIQNKRVKRCFLLWRERLRRVTIVQVYHEKDMMQRCLFGWQKWSSKNKVQTMKWQEFRKDSLLKQTFFAWKLRLNQIQEMEHRFHMCQKLRVHDMLERWHLWAAETTSRREVGEQLEKKFQLRRKAKTFWLWRQTFSHWRKIDEVYQSNLLRRCLRGLRNHISKRKDLQLKLDMYLRRKAKQQKLSAFILWQENHAVAVDVRMKEEQERNELAMKYYKRWQGCVMETRAAVLYETNLIRKMFHIWNLHIQKQIRLRVVVHQVVVQWRDRVAMNRALSQACDEWLVLGDQAGLRSSFSYWENQFRACVSARQHYEKALQARMFHHWIQHHRRIKSLRRESETFMKKKQRNVMKNSFNKMSKVYDRICDQHRLLECHLEAKDVETKQVILHSWHKMTQTRRAVRHHKMRLLKGVFTAWREMTDDCVTNNKSAGQFRATHDQQLLKAKFTSWLIQTKQSQRAKEHHKRTVETRTIRQWHCVIVKKKQLQTLVAGFQSNRNDGLVRVSWETWTTDWRRQIDLRERQDRLQDRLALRKQGELFQIWRQKTKDTTASKKYWKNILRNCFNAWHQWTRERREVKERIEVLQRRRRWRLQVVYGTIWKNRVGVAKFAAEFAEHKLLEVSWKRWRQRFIQEKQSKKFLESEHKWILNETFHAWRQVVLKQRGDKPSRSISDSGMVLDDPDTLSEVDTTQSSYRSSGFFSESDSEFHAAHTIQSTPYLSRKVKL